LDIISCYTFYFSHLIHYVFQIDIAKKIKNATQDAEAKIKIEEHAKGKPSSETLNKAKIKAEDAFS
jgi:hypothetical protein